MIAKLNSIFTSVTHHPDGGRLLLRILVAGLMIFHGVAKVSHGVDWIAADLAAKGVPSFVAYGVYIGEILAPAMVILGIFTAPAALVILINMIVAMLMVGSFGHAMEVTKVGAWALETDAFYVLGCVAIMMLGTGKYSVAPPAYR
ncbi:DoxX family protein [Klebsiella sp. BIGb0407]|uniref:DoxX family protein n=1 Tax=Klebsiella sp. BIGb0407 TaxID=2940603 RepID=UPI0021671271|nr:DoxX family protein [Klebsiella sp. BIGb0407]MCS3434121.1 putative oxidoreductase [Klebsiella sp. BIGb0407]